MTKPLASSALIYASLLEHSPVLSVGDRDYGFDLQGLICLPDSFYIASTKEMLPNFVDIIEKQHGQ